MAAADSSGQEDMIDTSTLSPNMDFASDEAGLSIEGSEHLSGSPAPPNADANKENSVDPALAREEHDLDMAHGSSNKFEPGYRFYLAFSSLAVLAMMVSLDGTSVSVALPVRLLRHYAFKANKTTPDHLYRSSRHSHRSLLDRYKFPT